MVKKDYDERAKELAAYYAVQFRVLKLYDTSSDMVSSLKEISPIVIKAVRKRRERNLKSLERLVKK